MGVANTGADGDLEKTTLYLPKGMKKTARRASAQLVIDEGEALSLSELVRFGLFRQLRAMSQGEEARPSGYPYEHGGNQ